MMLFPVSRRYTLVLLALATGVGVAAECPQQPFAPPVETVMPGCHLPGETREAAFCAAGPDGWRLCKCLASSEDSHRAVFRLQQNGKTVRRWSGEAYYGSVDDFHAVRADFNGQGGRQLLVANRVGETMGMGVRSWRLSVWPGIDASGKPATLLVQDFGPDALAQRPGSPACRVLATRWRSAGNHTEFVGVWAGVQAGRFAPLSGEPARVRRYRDSFEQERLGNSGEGLYFFRPGKWLENPDTRAVPDGRRAWREILSLERGD